MSDNSSKDQDILSKYINGPIPDRPFECSECKKDAKVWYTQIINNHETHQCMCETCPVLQKNMGQHSTESLEESTLPGHSILACPSCGTTLQEVRTGHPLACTKCYETFADVIVNEIINDSELSKINLDKNKPPLHRGRAPGKSQELNPSLRLVALNDALNDALKSEDYEQAAWIRDKIKDLTEESDE
jgi:protein arginine kinase activator